MEGLVTVAADPSGEMIVYRTDDGRTQIELRSVDGTVWLTQAEIAMLFDTTSQNITQHVRNIYAEGEQAEEATCKQLLRVRQVEKIAYERFDAFDTGRRAVEAAEADREAAEEFAELEAEARRLQRRPDQLGGDDDTAGELP